MLDSAPGMKECWTQL